VFDHDAGGGFSIELEVAGPPDGTRVNLYGVCLTDQTRRPLIERIARKVKDKRLRGHLRHPRRKRPSDGMRIVMRLRRDAYPQVGCSTLFKLTPLQSNFSAHMLRWSTRTILLHPAAPR